MDTIDVEINVENMMKMFFIGILQNKPIKDIYEKCLFQIIQNNLIQDNQDNQNNDTIRDIDDTNDTIRDIDDTNDTIRENDYEEILCKLDKVINNIQLYLDVALQ